MAVAFMFVSHFPKPSAGPVAATLTLPRPYGTLSPAPAGKCAEPSARRHTVSRPPLLSRRLLSLPPLSPPDTDCYTGAKWITATLPGSSAGGQYQEPVSTRLPAGWPPVPHVRAPFRVGARSRLPCPPSRLGHLSLGAPCFCISIAVITTATITVVMSVAVTHVVITNNSFVNAAECVRCCAVW